MPERAATQTSRRTLRAAPWLAALLLAGIAQFIRAVPVDGVIFLLVALVVAIDVVHPLSGRARLVHASTIVTIVVTVGAGVLLVLAPRHTIAEGVIVVALGLTAVLFAWPDRPTAGRTVSSQALHRTAVLWAIAGLTIGLWELVSFVLGRVSPDQKFAHPAISDLLDPALDGFWGRALFVAGWLLLGLLLLVPRRRS